MELDFKNQFKKLKLLFDKIDPFENYLGHVEYTHLDKDKIVIETTFSKQRGFYELLFKLVLAKTPIRMIFGGERQSESALGS
jgi:hypothetical protein